MSTIDAIGTLGHNDAECDPSNRCRWCFFHTIDHWVVGVGVVETAVVATVEAASAVATAVAATAVAVVAMGAVDYIHHWVLVVLVLVERVAGPRRPTLTAMVRVARVVVERVKVL